MKRLVTKSQFEFFKKELSHFEQHGVISSEQLQSMLSSYEVKARFSFIRILLIVGSILVGAGILSFIASNWSALPKVIKFLIILVGMTGFYLAGWKTEKTYPKTSKSLYYIGLAIYGAGIFLIGQMFHLGSDYQNAFLAWTVGALPLALYLNDRWVSLFAIVLMGIYASGSWNSYEPYPYALFAFIPLMYWMNEKKIGQSKLIFFFHNLLTILFICITIFRLADERIIPFALFVLGIGMMYVNDRSYAKVWEWQGSVLHGIAGIILSFSDIWKVWGIFYFNGIGIVFAVAYMVFLLYLLKRGSLPSIIVICGLIFRFYVDISYDFLPKSLFFVISGGILIAFGFWFEKKRKGGMKG
ncbi:DUF2157 domain-containing protein [Thermoflavimicrobium dichotomicum]|uniref:Uncharacterized membrane protein n=1 Tax=Thermoflavimicrobium dichotomicum TaxID=46223 RepID=A0A1I3S9I6_9BACL|nr:DUF2157 domain-containing protein [Thermoflavimicrobium dichotomicum]SFJ54197.1 Uncharacterized membrane protein [Thermoflavimicrobium dichotomicum]